MCMLFHGHSYETFQVLLRHRNAGLIIATLRNNQSIAKNISTGCTLQTLLTNADRTSWNLVAVKKKIPEFPCDLFLSILLNTYRHCSVTKMFIHFYIIFLGKPYNSGYTRNGRHRSNKYGETDDGLSPKCSGFCLCDKCSLSWWISKRQGIQCYIFLLL